jgi:tryptophan synthase alpha chain
VPSPLLSLADTFAELRRRRRIGLLPFIPAGYPDLATTGPLLQALEEGGASAVEVGFPFSDPVADGPVIQEAFTHALAAGVRVADVFRTVAAARPVISLPLVAMVSFSIVYRYGLERFAADARQVGFSGVIIPDLPPPEADAVCPKLRSAGLDFVPLVAPNTPDERLSRITSLGSGFVYCLAVAGVTGERKDLSAGIRAYLARLRQATSLPLAVGFGISKPEHIRQLQGHTDGAVVGSALVRQITQFANTGSVAVCQQVRDYCRSLLADFP